jgi:malonate-semialdehyde dehydrogenase (acetylating)/methylmalonate-semialdehyde dehydrogenase
MTEAKKLVIGEGSDPRTQMGPIITPHGKSRIIQKIEDAIREGATVALDGRNFSHHLLPNGNWLAPTVSPRPAPISRTGSDISRFYLGSSLG